MIRSLVLAALLGMPILRVAAADDTAAAVAEREAAEEREKRVNTRMEDMEKTLQHFEKRISALNEENRSLREELGKVRESNNDSQTRESIKRLKEAIEEVDKKRLEDNRKVVAALEDLQAFIKKSAASGSMVSRPAPTTGTAVKTAQNTPTAKPRPETENGYEYTIQDKDTLSGILAKLKAKGIKLTQKQMMDANPDVNWSKLKIGQKIFIPAP